ncbi:MAG: hypothetical protein Q8L48_36575 [Archangium sp.]|nr:hypothetical protein [Archangium sp.]
MVLLLAGCTLNPDALYRCETDAGCVQEGSACWSDGYCHPPADGTEDAGRDAGGRDSGVDAGTPDAGTPDGGEDAGFDGGEPDAGELDAGEDAGVDGGADAGADAGCMPAFLCPSGAQCGSFDAGCGIELDCGTCTSPLECGTTAPFSCGLPRVCTPDGVCWEHPLPQGNWLRSGWPIEGRRAWLAGDNGTILEWTGERTRFSNVPPLAGTDVLSIQSLGPSEAFAAGTDGLLLAWDGVSWQRETVLGGYSGTFNAVAAVGSGRAVAVGPNGIVVWRDPLLGTPDRWVQDVTIGTTTNLTAVHVAGGTIFVAAGNRTIYRATSATSGWMPEVSLPPPGGISELASAGGVVFALEDGRPDGGPGSRLMVRSAPGTWDLLADFSDRSRTVRGTPDSLWLSGLNTVTVVSLDGGLLSRWQGPNRDWYALAPMANGTAVLGGPGGIMGFGFADGGVTDHVLNNGAQRLGKLCAIPAAGGQVLVATSQKPAVPCPGGCFTRLMERRFTTRGNEWLSVEVQIPGSNGQDTLSCHVESPTRGWATTSSRYLLYRTLAGTWASMEPSSFDANWHSVWGPPGGPWDFMADHSSGYILRNSDGGTTQPAFTVVNSGFWSRMRAMTGAARGNAVAVGTSSGTQNGAYAKLQSNGTWSTNDYGPTLSNMAGLSARGEADGGSLYVAVGSGGAVWTMRNNAANFTNVPGFAAADLRDVWLSPSGDAWMVGDGGALPLPRVQVYFADGGRGVIDVPVAHGLSGVIGTFDADAGTSQVWVTGENGTVLTFTR